MSKRQLPLAAFNIPERNPSLCRYALDSARFNNFVVHLFDIFISWTSCGVVLLLSIVSFVSIISPRFNHVPKFPWVFNSLFEFVIPSVLFMVFLLIISVFLP